MNAKDPETTMARLIREAIESGEFDMSQLDPKDETLVRQKPEGTDEENAEEESPPAPPKKARTTTRY